MFLLIMDFGNTYQSVYYCNGFRKGVIKIGLYVRQRPFIIREVMNCCDKPMRFCSKY